MDVGIDRKAIWEIHGKRCHLCKLPVAFEDMALDHVVPLAQGGQNCAENLAPAHKKCNSAKGARTGEKPKGLRRRGFKRRVAPPKPPDDEGMF